MATRPLDSSRIEAFSDGVLAIVLTLMAFQLIPPTEGTFAALRDRVPAFAVFTLSFVFVAIYWSNHHHLLRVADTIDGRVMWANMLLLFCLTMVPPTTQWLGAHPSAGPPAAALGAISFASGLAYSVLVRAIVRCNPEVRDTLGSDRKGFASLALYAIGVVAALAVHPYVAYGCYVAVSLVWFVPDRRIARLLR